MVKRKRKPKKAAAGFLRSLSNEQLTGLAAELQDLRSHPPLTKRADGKYEGDILGFVKGLRLSARVIYFLRERLSATGLEVSWGHILNKERQRCSAECDIIVHNKGHVRRWNGDGGKDPIMEFKFVEAGEVKAVISCKSALNSIDKAYPADLRKYGVKHVFLFAECCEKKKVAALRAQAKKHGYKGVWVLYHPIKDTLQYDADGEMHNEFAERVLKTVTKGSGKKSA